MNYTSEKYPDESNSVIQKINLPGYSGSQEIFIRRDDLIHPAISGNKWRKMKYNLAEVERLAKTGILTFGGAFSNHIYATAAAGKLYGYKTIGIIRGESYNPLNPTLQYAFSSGMELYYLSRKEYPQKENHPLIKKLQNDDPGLYILPEGGTNFFALKGAAEITVSPADNFDYYCTASGTGGTAAGILTGVSSRQKVIAFPALKNGGFLREIIINLASVHIQKFENNLEVKTEYHFGGYAKVKSELIEFMEAFQKLNSIALDPVYTGKMMFGVRDMCQKGDFDPESRILCIHTGGLQGNLGMKSIIEKKIKNRILRDV
ncbi:MAG: pyridoxal-phosphate dependent enzyme [Ignavibacteriales bacterium]|nr:pyridoxal-phosphate dependent enzyme [Ignavibacteriales bacterium]MCF8306582.1 pyridoxal-phosphate dependent enzyme [Ignavibacteriales bacterium]MCF8316381.1 pyridoxal-phosphate dependent enzyme [Ignavibacteriales bacterium]MCF8437661.1 pyridoxal-phosphate dependent enzyme [Ignavibacteriales bacterium]